MIDLDKDTKEKYRVKSLSKDAIRGSDADTQYTINGMIYLDTKVKAIAHILKDMCNLS